MDTCCDTSSDIQTGSNIRRETTHLPYRGCERYTSAADNGTHPARSEAYHTGVCDRMVRVCQAHKQREQWVYTKGMFHAI